MSQKYDKIAEQIKNRKDELSEEVVDRYYENDPVFAQRYPGDGRRKSVRDQNYTFTFLADALSVESKEMFVQYSLWLGSILKNCGMENDVLIDSLKYTKEVVEEEFSGENAKIINEYVDSALDKLSCATFDTRSFLTADNPQLPLAKKYLDVLLYGDRRQASDTILNEVRKGLDIKSVYMNVFQPVQYEIGRLWQTKRISVAQEHFATAVTQLVMSQLYQYIFLSEKKNKKLVAACVGGELHEIGIRMVADMFELSGWDTYYLGANTPLSGLLQTLDEHKPNVAAFSATLGFHIKEVEKIVKTVKSEMGDETKIMVGGGVFNAIPDLWAKIGADGYGVDAVAAIKEAERLIKNN